MNSPSPTIVWFRRDLRLSDHAALAAAVESGKPVIPVYIRDPAEPFAGANGAAQAWWQHHSLVALSDSIRARGNSLLLLSGDPGFVLEWLIEQTGADSLYWMRRYDGPGRTVDTDIKARLKARGVDARSFQGFLMHDPAVLQTQQGKRFSVYTPFWKAFSAGFVPPEAIEAPNNLPAFPELPPSDKLEGWNLLPEKPNWAKEFSTYWTPGEQGAVEALDLFVRQAIDGYGKLRDQPALASTSRLSPHLAMGEISPHRLWRAVAGLEKVDAYDRERFLKEVVWREFAWHVLFHNPDLATVNLDKRFDSFPWQDDDSLFSAWTKGQTGYPIVDAGMRELWTTGVMHNRVRMIVASFLIKDLMIDWRRGEQWFIDTLVDADHASNPFSWQWVAGCGADAAPFFRIFNPRLQGEKFDGDGAYVTRWCPELKKVPAKYIHDPSSAPSEVLRAAGVILGKTYPRPIVDHFVARDRAMAAFQSLSKVDG